MRKARQTEQKEIGRIKLSDNQDLVASIVNDEKLDIRTWIEMDSYKGFTRKGIRFYLFDDNWTVYEICKNARDRKRE